MRRLIVDYTHSWRATTGLERISTDLFGPPGLDELSPRYVESKNLRQMLTKQWVDLPVLASKDQNALFLCPCFPPSVALSTIGKERVVPFVHDLFLITRDNDLSWRAGLYLRTSFKYAVKNLQRFFVNSNYTMSQLQRFCRTSAEIVLWRPTVRDVFNVADIGLARVANARHALNGESSRLNFTAIGTVEPRKNYLGALRLCHALSKRLGRPFQLNIIGRRGWGNDWKSLTKESNVKLHGYCAPEYVRGILAESDFFIAMSFDEGLGLPLLEAQYSGVPVIASDIPAFREVLGDSAIFVTADQTSDAIHRIAEAGGNHEVLRGLHERSIKNVARWNDNARKDRTAVIHQLEKWLDD